MATLTPSQFEVLSKHKVINPTQINLIVYLQNTTELKQISNKFMVKYFAKGQTDAYGQIRPLIENGLVIENSYYNASKGIAKSYQLRTDFQIELTKAKANDLMKTERIFMSSDGKTITNQKIRRQQEAKVKEFPLVELQKKAVKSIGNLILPGFSCLYSNALDDWHLISINSDSTEKDKLKAKQRIITLARMLEYGQYKDDCLTIKHLYTQQSCGRITALAGYQSLQRKDQQFLISKAGYDNWDIKSSQVDVLLQLLNEAGLPSNELQRLKEIGDDAIAEAIGIDADDFKKCKFSLFFGSELPVKLSKKPIEDANTPTKALWLASNLDLTEYNQLANNFKEILKPAFAEIKSYRNYDKKPLINAVGQTLDISKNKKQHVAFVVQSIEAAFIAYLKIISQKYDFEVVADFFDGAWIKGTIDKKAISEAQQLSGFTTAKFIPKPII